MTEDLYCRNVLLYIITLLAQLRLTIYKSQAKFDNRALIQPWYTLGFFFFISVCIYISLPLTFTGPLIRRISQTTPFTFHQIRPILLPYHLFQSLSSYQQSTSLSSGLKADQSISPAHPLPVQSDYFYFWLFYLILSFFLVLSMWMYVWFWLCYCLSSCVAFCVSLVQ